MQSGTPKLPIGVGSWLPMKDFVCVCVRGCVRVGGLSRWREGQYGRRGVITETLVSKLRELIPETWHFQVALIQGYHINLTLLSEWLPGRK